MYWKELFQGILLVLSYMNILKVLLSLVVFFAFSTKSNSQNEAKNWFFGFNCKLDFNTSPPTVGTGAANLVDNSTSISDSNGNLLFYTDGSTVWNKNNNIMPNGSGLVSHNSGGQCGLIVPIPQSPNKYVVFSNTEFSAPGQFHYSVVDMSLNSGLGDVIATQKNISLGTGWTEKLCAYYNCVGNYYWVLAHRWNSNQFVAIKVDPTGVTPTSVISSIGSIHNCGTYGGAHDAMGQMTISKDGTKVINALTCQDKFELFDFDINTGLLSNMISIPGNGGSAWGTGFSSDSKKLYVSSIFGQSIFQYDLSTYTSVAINASKITLYTTGTGGYNFGYMELGPDSKVYIARPNTNFLAVVNFPNVAGVGCNFSFNGLNLSPNQSSWGISRIAYNIAGAGNNSVTSVTSISDVTCNGLSNGSATISPVGAGPFNYNWTPGSYTTSVVNGLSSGIYTVNFNDGNCSSGTATVLVNQPLALNPQLTASSYTVCKDEIVNLSSLISGGTPSYSINWNSGATSPSISATPSITSIYNYTVTDANNCIGTSSVQINVENIDADFNYTATDCSNLVTFTNTSNYLSGAAWNFGDGSSSNSFVNTSNNYSVSGVYTVELVSSSPIGCKDSIERIVTIQSGIINPDFDYVIKKSNCEDSVLFINKTIGASNYNWYFGDGLSSFISSPSHFYSAGNYSVTLVASNTTCTVSISQNITLEDRTEIADIIPNVFTPNGDGINDVFDFKRIVPCGEFSFVIYNRWGLLILNSESNSSIWDGRTTSGEEVVDGTYFYVIDSMNGEKVKGTVTVFR